MLCDGEIRKCKECKTTYKRTGMHHLFCSRKCEQKNNYRKRNPPHEIVCGFCKQLFTSRIKKKYCNRKCSSSHHYMKNKIRLNKQSAEYYQQNKTVEAAKKRKKYKEDFDTRIKNILRSRLRHALQRDHKSGSAVGDLGCSIQELKQYLKSLFQPGMTWENYGRKIGIICWEIDHIKPLSKFDLSDPNELRRACNYTNLQPLWAGENRAKGNKYAE